MRSNKPLLHCQTDKRLREIFFNFEFKVIWNCFHVCLVIMIRSKKIHLLNEMQNQSRMVKQNRKGTKNTLNISVNLVQHNQETSSLGLMH